MSSTCRQCLQCGLYNASNPMIVSQYKWIHTVYGMYYSLLTVSRRISQWCASNICQCTSFTPTNMNHVNIRSLEDVAEALKYNFQTQYILNSILDTHWGISVW